MQHEKTKNVDIFLVTEPFLKSMGQYTEEIRGTQQPSTYLVNLLLLITLFVREAGLSDGNLTEEHEPITLLGYQMYESDVR